MAVVITGALIAVAECGATERAAFPGANGRIAFDAANSEDLSTQVYTVNAAGGDLRWISDVGGYPAFSPDGRAIAWSAGGTFSGGRGARVRITRRLNRDFPPARTLTHPRKGQGDFSPAWSPDGNRVAFVRCSRCDRLRRVRNVIYTVGLGDGRAARVARGASPAWSVGGEIALTRSGDLYTIAADGQRLRQITSGEPDDRSPDWSPDGLQLVFDRDGDVYTVPGNGGAVMRLTADGQSTSPTFSPDGQKILFAGNGLLRVMSAAGGPSVPLRTPGCTPPRCFPLGRSDWQPLPRSAGALLASARTWPTDWWRTRRSSSRCRH